MGNRTLRILQWSVALLVLCNVALVITLWYRPANDRPRHRGPRDFVIKELKMDDEQVRRYDELIVDHQRQMRQLRSTAMEYRRRLFTALTGVPQEYSERDSLVNAIAAAQRQIEAVTFEHFAEVRKLCRPQQQAEFDRIITEVIRRMNGPHPGPPPEREGPPNGGPEGRRPPPGE